MGKLKLINKEEFILEGVFEKFTIHSNAILDVEKAKKAIESYKTDKVDKGLSLGYLNEGFLLMPTEDGEQVVEEDKDPAFMVTDIWFNEENQSISGQIILLDTSDGIKVKNALLQGIECYVSNANIDIYPTTEKNQAVVKMAVGEIKGFNISLMNFHSTQF